MYQSPFLNEISDFMLARRYSKRTIKTYIAWIRSYLVFCDKQHPSELAMSDVERFLKRVSRLFHARSLAVNRGVSASTQALALNSLMSLYNKPPGQFMVGWSWASMPMRSGRFCDKVVT